MAEKKSFEAPNSKKPSIKAYASRVFEESAVGMVSSIAATSSKCRRVFKALVLIGCLFGFFYQSARFLTMVFEYPSVVDIDIIRPDKFIIPGFTFCDNNEMKRSLFCEKFPDYCEVPDEAFCNKHHLYCGNKKTLVPKKQYYKLDDIIVPEEIVNFNSNLSDFLVSNKGSFMEFPKGPLFRVKEFTDGFPRICYSLHDYVNSSLMPPMKNRKNIINYPIDDLTFHVDENEIFIPGTRPGVLFSIHSPFVAVNPLMKGTFLKSGRSYLVFLSMEEEILLKKPYDTDCINYTELWEANGRTGPRSQEMCLHRCFLQISKECFSCSFLFFYYPTDERKCSEDDFENNICTDIKERIGDCHLTCKDDCKRTKYNYIVQERYHPILDDDGDFNLNLNNSINVKIFIEEDEVVVLKHSPKYMVVEFFSTIGGFVGGWLGISLLDVSDIIEGFFRIMWYSLKRR